MRRTEQRSAILEEIRKRKDHPTAYDMYNAVKIRVPNISLGTVYRNLEVLSKKGVIRKLDLGSEQKRFDPNVRDHPHFRCVECGRVEDIPVEGVPEFNGELKSWLKQRVVDAVNIEFVGLCQECSARTIRRKK